MKKVESVGNGWISVDVWDYHVKMVERQGGPTAAEEEEEEEEEVDVVVLYNSSSGSGSSSRITTDGAALDDSGKKKKMEYFWPLQHPMEPPSEDQPVKCPITHYNSAPPPHITAPMPKEEEYYSRPRPTNDDDTESSSMKMKKKKKKLINVGDIDGQPRPLRKRHHAHSILTTTHS